MYGFVISYRIDADTIRERLIEVEGQLFDNDFEIWKHALYVAKDYLEDIHRSLGDLEKIELIYC